MTTEQTVGCRICGKPYKFYAYLSADQSACPKCVAEAGGDIVGYIAVSKHKGEKND